MPFIKTDHTLSALTSITSNARLSLFACAIYVRYDELPGTLKEATEFLHGETREDRGSLNNAILELVQKDYFAAVQPEDDENDSGGGYGVCPVSLINDPLIAPITKLVYLHLSVQPPLKQEDVAALAVTCGISTAQVAASVRTLIAEKYLEDVDGEIRMAPMTVVIED